jgi:hypothetical protein
VVEEQDRWLLLGPVSADAGGESGHWVRELARARTDDLIVDAATSEPARGGAVLMRRARPLRLLAVERFAELLAEAVRFGPVARLRIALQATPALTLRVARAMGEHAPELGIEFADEG